MISRYWTPAFAGVTSKSGVIPAKALHHMVFRAKAGIQDLKNVQTNMA